MDFNMLNKKQINFNFLNKKLKEIYISLIIKIIIL